MRLGFLVVLMLAWSGATGQETIVFSGYPISKVESGMEATAQTALGETQSNEYRVLIVKRDGKYYWASRENKELMHFQSGIAHWFVSQSSGYIKIVDPSLLPGNEGTNQYVYMEHLTLVLDTITYWGIGNALAP
jgi:hypothetical protein